MRRLISDLCFTAALLIGIVCAAQAQFNSFPPGVFTGRAALDGSSAPGCAGFSIDGASTSQPTSGLSTSTKTITTTGTNEIIFSIITVNSATVINTTDTAGLAWTSPRATGGSGNFIFESWALSTGALTADVITTNYSGTTSFVETVVFGVVGAKTSAPFDTGGASNVPVVGVSSPVSININATNSLALGFFRNSGSMGPQSTWTQIAAAANFTLAQFKAFSAQQTALSVSDPDSPNGAIGDALVCGP